MFCKQLLVPFRKLFFSRCVFQSARFSLNLFSLYYILNAVITYSILPSCVLLCVYSNDVCVACVRSYWIYDASIWYTGISAVFIFGGGICWWVFGHCWGTVGIGPCCSAILVCCVGNIWMNCECTHRLASGGSIPKYCGWGNKGLTLLSLHCLIIQELIKFSARVCMSDIYVLSISLFYTMAASKYFSKPS